MGFLSGKARGNTFQWCWRSKVFYVLGVNIAFYWFHEWSWSRNCWGVHLYSSENSMFTNVTKLVIDLGPVELSFWKEREL